MREETAARQQIIDDNLALLDSEAASLTERRLCQLAERAALLKNDGLLDGAELPEGGFDALFAPTIWPEDVSAEARPFLYEAARAQRIRDQLGVCRFLARSLKGRRDPILQKLFGAGSDLALKRYPRIAYVRNVYADFAFRSFSAALEHPAALYPGDFVAVCEEVYKGNADMCILPLDSSRDAKLISFYRLVDKYGLKSILTCSVVSSDQSVTTRYALLQKHMRIPGPQEYPGKRICFEFRFVPDGQLSLAGLLLAAEDCRLPVEKIDAIPLPDGGYSYDILLDGGEEWMAFALYLALAVPQAELIGIYPHLAAEEGL